jgi:outer membrane protein insertion porin family
MVFSGLDRRIGRALALVALIVPLAAPARGQAPPERPPRAGEANIVEVVIEGNSTPINKLPRFSTRAGQPFDPKLVEDDVRALDRTARFIDIKPKYQRVADGIVVIFQVVERPIIREIKYVGNKGVKRATLEKQSELKVGDAMDPHMIEDARRRMERHYHEKGFAKAAITTVEGLEPGDRKVVFLINEGNKQRVWWTRFEGNTISSDARLRTQIQAKPGILWFIGGYVDPKKIEADIDRLTAYYRSLGFFQAKVGRVLDYDEDQDWLTITYVVNEGLRYTVRSVSVIGNEKFAAAEIQEPFLLKSGDYFDQAKLTKDINSIRDLYGGQGYISVDVEADTRFVEDPDNPGQVDLVYDIAEGNRYQVGRISVKIKGEYPHTRQRVVWNRLSQRPGDIVDTRLIRQDEIRLKRSTVFENNPAKGQTPKIAIVMPDGEEHVARRKRPDDKGESAEKTEARAGSNFRGQSPDGASWPQRKAATPSPSQNVWPFVRERSADATNRTVVSSMRDVAPPHNVARGDTQPAYRAQDPGYGGSAIGATGPAGRSASAYQPSKVRHSVYSAPAQSPVPASAATTNRAPAQSSKYFDPRVERAAYQTPGPETSNGGGQIIYGPPGGNIQPGVNVQPGVVVQPGTVVQPPDNVVPPGGGAIVPNGGFVAPNGGYVAPGAAQPFNPPPVVGGGALPDPNVGPIGGVPAPVVPGGVTYGVFPQPDVVDLEAIVSEAQTGRLMFGVGVNSNAGLIGNIVLDEQNFDITRWPSSWEDFRNGTAWRGAGQRFRVEAAPGTQVSRYVISFAEPYLFDTPISGSISGSYYQRFFRDWREERTSLRTGLGYQFPFRPDLSINFALRLEEVEISEPRTPTPPELLEVLGTNTVVGLKVGLMHDTRDSPFLPTEGFMTNYEFEQVLGSFSYPRFIAEASRYFTLRQHPDGSGRHVFKIGGEFGVTGEDTPIYDHFFAGGFNTLRGFRYRGASPRNLGVIVGGELELLGTLEYMFPITADDMIRGVVFTDLGTVEREIEINDDNFRLAPGFGLRITVPALGPAPLAFDFAFPILEAEGDENQVFAFFVGINR